MTLGTMRSIAGTRTRFATFGRNDALRAAMILLAGIATIAILLVLARDWPAPTHYSGLE